MPTVLVIVPTYNEAENIEALLAGVLASPVNADVLVVDDASPDGTGRRVAAAAAADPRVHLLTRPGKAGLGPAYRAGFGWARERGCEVVVQMDADGSHPVAALPAMVEATTSADLVLGSRYCAGGSVMNWPLRRQALSHGGNAYARLLLGLPYRDLTGGFKAWRSAALAALPETGAGGYAFQIETTLAAVRSGARVVEVPIVFADRQHGRSKMSGAIAREAVVAVLRLRRKGLARATTATAPSPAFAVAHR